MLKILFFIFISTFIILYITNRKNQENFNTTQAGTTSASGSGTTSASGSGSGTTSVSGSGTTSVSGSGTTSASGSGNVELDEYNNSLIGQNVNDSMEMGTNYDNYFQGGFCKYQQKLGYQVGCSEHIYDNAFFNIDRELNSVKQNYSILKS